MGRTRIVRSSALKKEQEKEKINFIRPGESTSVVLNSDNEPSLMSEDMRRERERQKWYHKHTTLMQYIVGSKTH